MKQLSLKNILFYTFTINTLLLVAYSVSLKDRRANLDYNIFSQAINNSITTRGVTRLGTQGASGDQTQVVVKQDFIKNISVTENKQFQSANGNESSLVTKTVRTPSIGSKSFTEVKLPNSPLDFSKVLGVWIDADKTGEEDNSANKKELYAMDQVSLVPYSFVKTKDQKKIHESLMGAYKVVARTEDNDNYIYTININVKKYVQSMNLILASEGFDQLGALTEENYEDDQNITTKYVINKKTKYIIALDQDGEVAKYINHNQPVIEEAVYSDKTEAYLQELASEGQQDGTTPTDPQAEAPTEQQPEATPEAQPAP